MLLWLRQCWCCDGHSKGWTLICCEWREPWCCIWRSSSEQASCALCHPLLQRRLCGTHHLSSFLLFKLTSIFFSFGEESEAGFIALQCFSFSCTILTSSESQKSERPPMGVTFFLCERNGADKLFVACFLCLVGKNCYLLQCPHPESFYLEGSEDVMQHLTPHTIFKGDEV